MENTNTIKYLKTYLWQGAAFLLRFLSLFIVTPYLTKDPTTYGIYAVCLSVTVFLGYADLGFLQAGQKYAAECYTRGERAEEMRYIGFGTFILLVFTLLCAAVFCYLGYHPQVLIKGLDTPIKVSTASNLLFILAAFAPVTVLQRMVAMIFAIRLEAYINQRISLFASILTIVSVFYLFGGGNYRIVPYFFFFQTFNFIAVVVSLWIAKKKYEYNIQQLFRYVSFNSDIYKKAEGLAYSGLYLMFVWIVFYELDQMAIGKYLGAEKVAIFSIAFTFAVLFRSIYGVLFFPFTVQANHFVGKGDDAGLKRFCLQLVTLSAPLVVIPTVALALVAKPFILSWVGVKYTDSVPLARLFSLVFMSSFIGYTASMIFTAKVQLKEMCLIATIQPIIYWPGILATYSVLGLLSFASFKLAAVFISDVYCFYLLTRFFNMSVKELFKKTIYPLLGPLVFLVAALLTANRYLPCEKSRINLLIVLVTAGMCISVSMGIQYLASSDIQIAAKSILRSIFPKKLTAEIRGAVIKTI